MSKSRPRTFLFFFEVVAASELAAAAPYIGEALRAARALGYYCCYFFK